MRWTLGRKLVALAALVGLLAGLAVWAALRAPRERPGPLRPVVIARQDIPARARITADMIAVVSVPPEYAHAEALAAPADVVGTVTKVDLVRGEQVARSRISKGALNDAMAFRIPEGRRAVAINVDAVAGVGGYVEPGDRVDVLATFSDRDRIPGAPLTLTMLQSIEVLAVFPAGDQPSKRVPTTMTLALTPAEAQFVALAERLGVVRLALRPATDVLPAPLAPALPTAIPGR